MNHKRLHISHICPKCGSTKSNMIPAKGTEWYSEVFGINWNPYYFFGNRGMHFKCLNCKYEEDVEEIVDNETKMTTYNRVISFITKVEGEEFE